MSFNNNNNNQSIHGAMKRQEIIGSCAIFQKDCWLEVLNSNIKKKYQQ
jgi:hypothetical protein